MTKRGPSHTLSLELAYLLRNADLTVSADNRIMLADLFETLDRAERQLAQDVRYLAQEISTQRGPTP